MNLHRCRAGAALLEILHRVSIGSAGLSRPICVSPIPDWREQAIFATFGTNRHPSRNLLPQLEAGHVRRTHHRPAHTAPACNTKICRALSGWPAVPGSARSLRTRLPDWNGPLLVEMQTSGRPLRFAVTTAEALRFAEWLAKAALSPQDLGSFGGRRRSRPRCFFYRGDGEPARNDALVDKAAGVAALRIDRNRR